MPQPRLIHPIPVFLRKKDLAHTPAWDHNLGEPIGQVHRKLKPIRLIAQVKIGDTDRPRAATAGIEEQADGYLLFKTADLDSAHVTIERGDNVVQLGEGEYEREVNYYITKFAWRGHYPQFKGPTLLKAWFEDRHPSRQKGDL